MASIQLPVFPEALPSPLSSRPERSGAERSLCGCLFLEMFIIRNVPGFRQSFVYWFDRYSYSSVSGYLQLFASGYIQLLDSGYVQLFDSGYGQPFT
jgi:hypothetical protein